MFSQLVYLKELSKLVTAFLFVVPIILFLAGNEAIARYFLLLTPFIVILSSLGLSFLISLIKRYFQSSLPTFLVPLLFILFILPTTKIAFDSTNHLVLENAIKFVRESQ